MTDTPPPGPRLPRQAVSSTVPDVDQDYTVVVMVHVAGYGKREHEEQTVKRISREMKLRFGENNVTVDLLNSLRGDESKTHST